MDGTPIGSPTVVVGSSAAILYHARPDRPHPHRFHNMGLTGDRGCGTLDIDGGTPPQSR